MSFVPGTKNVTEAAEEIGVTRQTLILWIHRYFDRCPSGRAQPRELECRALKREDTMFAAGFVWQVPVEEIERLKATPKVGPGRPRISA